MNRTDLMPYHAPEAPVPPLRYDINVIPVQQNGTRYLLVHDPLLHAPDDLIFPEDIHAVLRVFNGKTPLTEIHKRYFGKSDINLSQLTDFVSSLDQNRLLHSPYYRQFSEMAEADFERMDVRPAVCSGLSYPTDPVELKAYFDDGFGQTHPPRTEIKALYAPHIDFRVGIATYAKAFSEVRNLKPSRVVVIGTSHYAGYYGKKYDDRPFILSGKSFSTPLGTVHADNRALQLLKQEAGEKTGISLADRAHRVEHSIELHVLLCQYLWGDSFSLVPILVDGLDEYQHLPTGNQGRQLRETAGLIRKLDDGSTLFLISGDQAHVGRKFGDGSPASEIFDAIRKFDSKYLGMAAGCDTAGMENMIREVGWKYRVCGFPPLLLFAKAFPDAKGRLVDYQIWDEREQESAVSYAAITYR